MKIVLNGKKEEIDLETNTVSELLSAKAWSFPLITVSINGKHIPREEWPIAVINDDDIVEAIHLMSGG